MTHSAGVAKATAEWIVDGHAVDRCARMRPVPVRGRRPRPEFIMQTSSQAFVEVYDIIHPLPVPRPRCAACGPARSTRGRRNSARSSTRAAAGNARAGSRRMPNWRNDFAPTGWPFPERDDWSSRFWSPISIAEAHWTRERVAMYDMTPLTRYEIAGAGAAAFLQRMTTNNVDKSVGSVTYTLLLDETGGIRSDITVARLADTGFQVAVNGPMDFDWLQSASARRRHRCATSPAARAASACGVRWPATWSQPLCPDDLSHEAFKYFRAHADLPRRDTGHHAAGVLCRRARLGDLHQRRIRGRAVGSAVRARAAATASSPPGGSRSTACASRRATGCWGTDMTAEHLPAAAGVDFAVRMNKDDFIGKAALRIAPPHRRSILRSIVFDDPTAVALGKEPVYRRRRVRRIRDQRRVLAHGRAHHRLRLAARRHRGGRRASPSTTAAPGSTATVHAEPVVDPEMARIKR